jgi:hypothetical protein
VHPIERLRYVARASGVPATAVVAETAAALASFGDDPHGLITACQRVVARQPSSAPLVWFAARVVTSGDPASEIWEAAGALHADRTSAELAAALPDDATVCLLGWPDLVGEALPRRGDLEVLVVDVAGEGIGLTRQLWQSDVHAVDVPQSGLAAAVVAADLVLLEAGAIAPTEFLAVSGSRAAASVARLTEVPVWLVGGVGRLLPLRMWEGMRSRLEAGGDEPWDADDEIVPLDLVDRIAGPQGVHDVAAALRLTDCPVAPELFRGVVM